MGSSSLLANTSCLRTKSPASKGSISLENSAGLLVNSVVLVVLIVVTRLLQHESRLHSVSPDPQSASLALGVSLLRHQFPSFGRNRLPLGRCKATTLSRAPLEDVHPQYRFAPFRASSQNPRCALAVQKPFRNTKSLFIVLLSRAAGISSPKAGFALTIFKKNRSLAPGDQKGNVKIS